MRILTEKDYKVMSKLLDRKENKGLSKTTGLTRKELAIKCDVSYSKVRDAIDALIEYDYVAIGISKGREKTYYLTLNGLNELKNISNTVIKIKKGGNNE